MVREPLKAKKIALASSKITWTAARSQGETWGSIQASASPAATIIASGVPPRQRNAQNRLAHSINPRPSGVSRIRFKLFTDSTALDGSVMLETCSRVLFRKAPPPLDAQQVC